MEKRSCPIGARSLYGAKIRRIEGGHRERLGGARLLLKQTLHVLPTPFQLGQQSVHDRAETLPESEPALAQRR